MRRATSLIHTCEIKRIAQFIFNYLTNNKIPDIHQREDTDHVNAIFSKGPQTAHVVRVGDLVPVPRW